MGTMWLSISKFFLFLDYLKDNYLNHIIFFPMGLNICRIKIYGNNCPKHEGGKQKYPVVSLFHERK